MAWTKGQNAIPRLQIAKRLSDGWMRVGLQNERGVGFYHTGEKLALKFSISLHDVKLNRLSKMPII